MTDWKDSDKAFGKKAICKYFECSWSKAKSVCHAIKDTTIFYYTIAKRPVLIIPAYEKKYGKPMSSLPK